MRFFFELERDCGPNRESALSKAQLGYGVDCNASRLRNSFVEVVNWCYSLIVNERSWAL